MIHNLSERDKFPKHHIWNLSNKINVYAQGIRITTNDEILYKNKTFKVLGVHKEEVKIPEHKKERTYPYHEDISRPYVKKETVFYVLTVDKEIIPLTMCTDRGSSLTEYSVPALRPIRKYHAG